MLEQFSDQIRLCYERTAEAKERADSTNESAIKAEFLAAEKRWLTLACSYGFSERGGPPAEKPARRGFGTSVIDKMIRQRLKGKMHFDWRAEGLVCEIGLKM